jgi:ribonuclease HII
MTASLVAGADEAGRGPVIGPLVICLAICAKETEPDLRKMGVKDSKLLRPERREELAPEVRKLCEVHVAKITAKELNSLMQKGVSLNAIEAMKLAELIREVDPRKLEKIETIHIDSPDPIASKFSHRIKSYLPSSVKIEGKLHSSHKADVIYPVCSAASVIAKTVRDAEIEKIKKEVGCDFGTGYSHDAATIACMEKYIETPTLSKYLRSEWSTTKNMLKKLKFKTKQVKLNLED